RTIEHRTFSDVLAAIAAVVVAALGIFLVATTKDGVMVFHGALLAAGAIGGLIMVAKTSFSDGIDTSGYLDGPIKVAVVFAIFWGIAGFLVGDIIAWQMAFPAL